ncbi:hypothetical protein ACQPW1_10030 [Nocardia sp. CA-128927]|uniref:hypothetical protein n=1 Tax=Nocardia sp. CA-128927 TaxID=3239975 RepID=UPI003D963245
MAYNFHLHWFGEDAKAPSGSPTNPAVEAVMQGEPMDQALKSIAQEAKALFMGRVPKGRTRVLMNSARIRLGFLATTGTDPLRPAAELLVEADYAAAVEFDNVNKAKDYPRPDVRNRVQPGGYPPRYAGRHTLGGDNRRLRSVVADIERKYLTEKWKR